jgi:hypothetical protein
MKAALRRQWEQDGLARLRSRAQQVYRAFLADADAETR